jgi:hypothetical protein
VTALRVYLAAVGAVLLVQGPTSLLLHEALDVDISGLHGFLTTDDRHAVLHILWGVILLAGAGLLEDARLVTLGLVFGVFYAGLGVLGVVVDDPFGLRLGWGENVFHLLIGSLGLVFAVRARPARALARTG